MIFWNFWNLGVHIACFSWHKSNTILIKASHFSRLPTRVCVCVCLTCVSPVCVCVCVSHVCVCVCVGVGLLLSPSLYVDSYYVDFTASAFTLLSFWVGRLLFCFQLSFTSDVTSICRASAYTVIKLLGWAADVSSCFDGSCDLRCYPIRPNFIKLLSRAAVFFVYFSIASDNTANPSYGGCRPSHGEGSRGPILAPAGLQVCVSPMCVCVCVSHVCVCVCCLPFTITLLNARSDPSGCQDASVNRPRIDLDLSLTIECNVWFLVKVILNLSR